MSRVIKLTELQNKLIEWWWVFASAFGKNQIMAWITNRYIDLANAKETNIDAGADPSTLHDNWFMECQELWVQAINDVHDHLEFIQKVLCRK